ncbi:hypothetical protein, partial [Streptomyces lonegramiae]
HKGEINRSASARHLARHLARLLVRRPLGSGVPVHLSTAGPGADPRVTRRTSLGNGIVFNS